MHSETVKGGKEKHVGIFFDPVEVIYMWQSLKYAAPQTDESYPFYIQAHKNL